VADINVERKQGPGIWPWIIGVIILALILWWLFARGRTDRTEPAPAVDTTTAVAPAPAGGMGAMPSDTMGAGAAMGDTAGMMPSDTAGAGAARDTGQAPPAQ
jgi:hypothetical protein